MEKIILQKNELEILQACLKYFKERSTIQKVSEMAGHYLDIVEQIINGKVQQISSVDFWEIHSYVITIFSGLLDNKGRVVNSNWADKYWESLLITIEKCYGKDDIYEVTK